MKILNDIKYKIIRNNLNISVIGLGYVGLPVAFYFSKKFNVKGLDINKKRILDLKNKKDNNKSYTRQELNNSKIKFISNYSDIADSDIIIMTLPTPMSKKKQPNLKFIFNALNSIVKIGIKNKVIILESTVFPGASDDLFIKYLEKKSKLLINKDFFYGYSPERINPGDKKNQFNNISKVVAGSNKLVLDLIFHLYKKVVRNVYKSSSILCAEFSKIIENTQRDWNIAYVNEISIICDKFKIKSSEALKLSSTKWNFLNFKPGLVGGHCIGIDPYYLFHAAKKIGYDPKTLLAGRNVNEFFPKFLAKKFLSYFKKKNLK